MIRQMKSALTSMRSCSCKAAYRLERRWRVSEQWADMMGSLIADDCDGGGACLLPSPHSPGPFESEAETADAAEEIKDIHKTLAFYEFLKPGRNWTPTVATTAGLQVMPQLWQEWV